MTPASFLDMVFDVVFKIFTIDFFQSFGIFLLSAGIILFFLYLFKIKK